MLNWEKLLSEELLTEREETPGSWERYELEEFERGRSAVMGSAPFRALQDKTQALSAGSGKNYHTRLTHSLEVAEIGDRFGKMICLSKEGRELFGEKAEEYARSFSSVLSTAGLLHDFGNPPFGHFGETGIGFVLGKILRENEFRYKGRLLNEVLTGQMMSDLTHFEGNAETLRVLLKTRLNPCPDNPNVSCAVINTLIKYPVSSPEARHEARDARIRKYSIFLSEAGTARELRESVGLSGCSRYPLTFLLEAADDISYLLSDIADVFAGDTLNILQIREYFRKELRRIPDYGTDQDEMEKLAVTELFSRLEKKLDAAGNPEEIRNAYRGWLDYVKNWLMYAAVHSFFAHYAAIMEGSYAGELLADSWYYYGVKILKGLKEKAVYDERRKTAEELAACANVNALLRLFVPAVLHWTAEDEVYRLDPLQQACIRFLPEKLKSEYLSERTGEMAFDLYLRILTVTDFLCSLTDSEAKDILKAVQGRN